MEEIERYETMESTICCECVIDTALSDLVHRNAKSENCSYCDNGSALNPCASFNLVFERILEAIGNYFGDANQLGVPWDGGYIVEQSYPDEVVGEVDPGWNDQLLDDILSCIDYETYWVPQSQGSWMMLDPEETMASAWQEFTDVVLNKTRYFFDSEPPSKYDMGRPDYIPVKAILENIGTACIENGLVKTTPIGAKYYRARASKENILYGQIEDIGVAPHAVTGSGRMNPAGIPYLYLAEDTSTAIEEVDMALGYSISVAEFETIKSVRLLDLVDLPESPSKFLPELYDRRHEIQFIHGFAKSIALPVEKNGREHVEYVPSQIVSEYFRFLFKYLDEHIHGIRFRSSKSPDGVCVTIFASDNDEALKLLSLNSAHIVSSKAPSAES